MIRTMIEYELIPRKRIFVVYALMPNINSHVVISNNFWALDQNMHDLDCILEKIYMKLEYIIFIEL